ncbi:MAG: homoserine kinase, partial [Verrucomicrobia bacterium]|nr:homoserine kinase [Verrucomicrobiota bacterium]
MKSPHLRLPFWIRVPATTANLGPGFDALAIALDLHNY